MSVGKHTPGPWVYVEAASPDGQEWLGCGVQTISGNEFVWLEYDAERDIPTARLIAAAPDLLSALKLFRTKVYNAALGSGMDHEWATEACSLADAAISKAEGGAE